jgi:hypothetical protein
LYANIFKQSHYFIWNPTFLFHSHNFTWLCSVQHSSLFQSAVSQNLRCWVYCNKSYFFSHNIQIGRWNVFNSGKRTQVFSNKYDVLQCAEMLQLSGQTAVRWHNSPALLVALKKTKKYLLQFPYNKKSVTKFIVKCKYFFQFHRECVKRIRLENWGMKRITNDKSVNLTPFQ